MARATAQLHPSVLAVLHIQDDESLRLKPSPRLRQSQIYFVFAVPRVLRLAGSKMSPELFLQITRVKLRIVSLLQDEEHLFRQLFGRQRQQHLHVRNNPG
jgi:hypothetical protein